MMRTVACLLFLCIDNYYFINIIISGFFFTALKMFLSSAGFILFFIVVFEMLNVCAMTPFFSQPQKWLAFLPKTVHWTL